MVNILLKALMIALFCIMSGSATTITFNGCSNTPNDYFTFTSSGNEYCIAKCIPKLNPESATTMTLKIPGSVNGNQVSLAKGAFDWNSYQENFANLKVNLIFEKSNNTYVQMPANCSYIFREYNKTSKIAKLTLDLSGISTNNVTDMTGMFRNCSKLTSLDLSNFNTKGVTNMAHMFNLCSGLTSLTVSSFDTSNVINMSSMFQQCSNLSSLNVSNFDTNNVTSMGHMFYLCKKLISLNLSNFTGYQTALDYLVSGCSKLTYLDISNIDIRSARYIANIFEKCSILATLKISEKFSPPSDTLDNQDAMFSGCNASINIIGIKVNQFIVANAETKSQISSDANKLYIFQRPSAWISDGLKEIAEAQLESLTYEEEPETTDLSKMFIANSTDSLYIGQSEAEQTFTIEGADRTISGALINKAIDGIGYYPANFRLTGTISLSGDNSEFNQKSFLVGDGISDTIITLTNPNALPRTNTTVEPLGTLVFGGSGNYTLLNDITIKSGGNLNAIKRIMITNGAKLKFEE